MSVSVPRLAASVVALLLCAIAQAQSPAPAARPTGAIHAIEQAIETRAAALALPSGGIGTLVVTPCASCQPVSMLAGSASIWMLGDRAVGFEELRRALQAYPRAPVLVFYRGAGAELTRLIAQVPRTPAP